MATIQAKTDGKKIISYKFKTCVGRDKDGKQVFRCHTWYPPADLPKIKCKKEAQKEAIIWEEEAKKAFLREQAAKAVADSLAIAQSKSNAYDTLKSKWDALKSELHQCQLDAAHEADRC